MRSARAIERRLALTDRLVAALAHLPRDCAMGIVTAWIGIEKLDEIVKFQENRT